MDYTDCTNMFSNGQRSRMHAALHSSVGGRINLWQYDNLVATGLINDSECNDEEIIVQINTGSYANEISSLLLTQIMSLLQVAEVRILIIHLILLLFVCLL